jgi:hypothetical protein
MSIDSVPAREYRDLVEQAYCNAIVKLIQEKHDRFEISQIVPQALSAAQRDELENSSIWDKLNGAAPAIEHEVCLCILYYLRKAQHIHSQQMSLVGQAILDYERVRLGLAQSTVDAINRVIMPDRKASPPPTNQKKLDQYYQHLFTALQRDRSGFKPGKRDVIPLKSATQAELKLLQRVLEIPDRDIPPAEMLWSECQTNYILLWRFLDQKDWKAANFETLKRLLEASGQPKPGETETVETIKIETIDLERIPLVDLQTIDGLWSKASNGRFGFKAQLKLWREVDAGPDKGREFENFGKLVDWRRNNSWISYSFADFSDNAARGHLPTFPLAGWWCWARMALLMKQVEAAFAAEKSQPEAPSIELETAREAMQVNINQLNQRLNKSAAA